MIYLDSSALVKLVVAEAETDALRELLASEVDQVSSAIVEVEVVRAVRRGVPSLTAQAQVLVAQLTLVEVTATIRARAAVLEPAGLRSLDAIHLATAVEVADELDAVVAYDHAFAAAARAAGLSVLAPGSP